jgi:hypothetical protein
LLGRLDEILLTHVVRIFGPFLSNLSRDLARAKKHLVPIIEERLKLEDEHGPNWSERPVF